MTFTELEYVLFIAVGVLMWRITEMQRKIDKITAQADKYVDFLINVGKGKGMVVKNDIGVWEYKAKEKP